MKKNRPVTRPRRLLFCENQPHSGQVEATIWRLAASPAFHSLSETSPEAVLFHRLDHVHGAGGLISAAIAHLFRCHCLIDPYHTDQNLLGEYQPDQQQCENAAQKGKPHIVQQAKDSCKSPAAGQKDGQNRDKDLTHRQLGADQRSLVKQGTGVVFLRLNQDFFQLCR